MKKHVGLALSAGLFFGGLVATPAHAADPAPTNVKISWKDDTFEFVHVTWEETGDQPNRVFVRPVGGTAQKFTVHVAADGENTVDLRKDLISEYGSRNAPLEVGVAVGTAEGLTSPVAVSAAFDTTDAGAPKLVSWSPVASSTLNVRWAAEAPPEDTTPGDPLDRSDPVIFHPRFRIGTAEWKPAAPAGTATALTFTGPPPPYDFSLLSQNEWFTGLSSEWIRAGQTKFTANVPAWVVAGANTVISGTYTGPEHLRATLQARNSATSPWYAVASYDLFDQTYRFAVPSRGTRQYRVAFGNTTGSYEQAWFGGYSAAVTTTTQQKAVASLAASKTFAGEKVPAYLTVNPAVNGTATLQRWNGKAWTVVGSVAVKNGEATGIIHQTTVGSTAYRYYVPAHTFNGLGVAAAYSQQFVLTTYR
ncbi:hypothetical protein [Kribbella lupini]|uniref:Uncharacterized protein n=1 Tax=Kribbella lupini TaxID=291602 RepID=A0ABP4N6D0_9ACTN